MNKKTQKSYDKKPTLYLITTPIGNMNDITHRAIETLKEVDVVLAEDTRVTLKLLNHFQIKKKLIANHKFNERTNIPKIIEILEQGKNIGMVSDRGTPIISDPGYEIVKSVIENNYNVVAIPGVTALIPALIVSGITPMPFTFYGFLNSNENKHKHELEELKKQKETIIFYEAPHRIEQTLKSMLEILGDRQCSISREITKRYEEVYRGKISEIIPQIINSKGEMVIVVAGNSEKQTYEHLTIIEHVNLYIKEGNTSMEAIKKVAKERKLNKNEVYMHYHGKE